MEKDTITMLVIYCLALATGVTGGVLSILQNFNVGLFFGVAIFCLSVNGLIQASKKIK